ncbi:hypothetical protein NP493_2085g00001 [Ridgeia piscesae]|uniref:Uncharacterized protein n=1 Tax=Ridgeia piscesae TaxID=27915 RepID=A0AAD9JLI5_RIDPI|nr:hypothetical protein NP493_2085g00001 [Ridgeia piscesae]
MLFAAATPLQSTGGTAQSSATIGIGALVGTAVGALLLGMAIMAFILLGIPRIRHWKDKTDTTIQDTEMSPTQLTDHSFEDAQGYVIPPKQPQGQEGVADDAGGYYNTARETDRPDGHNVYDVILT